MALGEIVDRIRVELYKAEYFSDEDFDFDIPPAGTREHARFCDWYAEVQRKRVPEVTHAFHRTLNHVLKRFGRAVPQHQSSIFKAPIADFIPDIGQLIEEMIELFYDADHRLFDRLKKQIAKNTERVDGARPRKLADQMEPRDVVRAYFGGTPLEALFREEVPVPISEEVRFEGLWTLARPGAGKTHHVFSTLIYEDLKRVAEGRASVVIMDSQGDQKGQGGKPPPLLYLLPRLKMFAPGQPLHGKLTYIKLDDIRPPRFNIFDMGLPGTKESKFALTRRLMQFIFSSEVGADFSGPMDRLFSACLRLMLTIPGATIADMRRLLHENGAKQFAKYIDTLDDPDDRNLFNAEIKRTSMGATHSALLSRLEGIKSYPLFERLVSHKRTELSLFDELEEGRVIIIDTNSGVLEDGTAIVGRFFIALLGAVSRRRGTVPEDRKTPVYAYIDELADYCKKGTNANHLDEILATCRKQNISINLANQRMSQMSGDPSLLDGLKQCAVKFAAPLAEDAYKIAVNMGETAAKSITNFPDGRFGLHVVGMPRAVRVNIPRGPLMFEPFMSPEEYDRMWDEMRQRYARYSPPDEPPPDDPEPEPEGPTPPTDNDPPPTSPKKKTPRKPPDDPNAPPWEEGPPQPWKR